MMASIPAAALSAFCATIFETKTRSIDYYNPVAAPEIMAHAVNVKQYLRSVFDDALAGGRVTQAQYDTMAAMPNFPPALTDRGSTTEEDQGTMDVVPESESEG